MVKSEVLITLKTERSVKGILWRTTWRYLVLKGASVFNETTHEFEPADGELLVPRASIDYIQKLK